MGRRLLIALVAALLVVAATWRRLSIGSRFQACPERSSKAPPRDRNGSRDLALLHSDAGGGSRARATNPLKPDRSSIAEGATSFQQKCSVCHGFDEASRTTIGEHVYPRAPSLFGRRAPIANGWTGLHLHQRRHTRNTAMPAWRSAGKGSLADRGVSPATCRPQSPPRRQQCRAIRFPRLAPCVGLSRLPILSPGNL